MKKTMVVAVLTLLAPLANAEVTDSAANGFTTVNEVVIADERAAAWVAAVAVGRWWSSDHTVSGDAARMSIEPVTQGCFCETLGEQAGVVHLVVTMVNPTHLLRMTGGLGPLGLMGLDGNMTWEFIDDENGTRVRFTYAVGGYSAGGLDKIAPAVDAVIGEALGRLKAYVETGNPEPAAVD
ncbi:MAG: SRPBCC family protein [Gammaproteobacteria bacterium]|nr:SRPBCC family protein [Gammaproteobacteria bacterium]